MAFDLITFNSPQGRLDAVQDGERKWLRVGQICPTLGITGRSWNRIIERDPDLVPDGHSATIPWPSAGGEQMVRVYTLDAVLNVAMEVNNRQARRIRRWLVALLRGQAPVPRPAPNALSHVPDARALLARPLIQSAIARLDTLDAADAAHQRRQARERLEATRMARLAGFTLDEVRKLRQLERILASIPSLREQGSLPLDA